MSKKYRVIGQHPVLGHAPEKTFVADLDPDHEARLLQRGSLIKVAKRDDTTKKSDEATASDEQGASNG